MEWRLIHVSFMHVLKSSVTPKGSVAPGLFWSTFSFHPGISYPFRNFSTLWTPRLSEILLSDRPRFRCLESPWCDRIFTSQRFALSSLYFPTFLGMTLFRTYCFLRSVTKGTCPFRPITLYTLSLHLHPWSREYHSPFTTQVSQIEW